MTIKIPRSCRLVAKYCKPSRLGMCHSHMMHTKHMGHLNE